MENLSERLDFVIKTLNINRLTLAKKLGVSQSYVSNILTGKKEISRSFMEKLSKNFPLINLNWLLTGSGESFISPSDTSLVSEISMPYEKQKPRLFFQDLNQKFAYGNIQANLHTAKNHWRMYDYQLFALLDPGAAKPAVSRIMSGKSELDIIPALRFEAITGIPLRILASVTVKAEQLPPKPIDPNDILSSIMADLARCQHNIKLHLDSTLPEIAKHYP